MLWDSFEYIKYAIQSNDCLNNLKLKYNEIGKGGQITNLTEIPKDIINEIKESALFEGFKRIDYDISKKKDTNLIDLITFMTKLSGETKLFTFEHIHAQKQIIKLHQYLLKMKPYIESCTLYNLEFNHKHQINFEKEKSIPSKTIAIKSITDNYTEEEKFIYCLGLPDKELASKREHG